MSAQKISSVSIIKPPESIRHIGNGLLSVFLAGSIEMGKAENWQERVQKDLDVGREIYIANPRRDIFDASLEQKIENPTFFEQVNWELTALERVDVIAMYFAPETKSPISLLELGLHAKSGKLIVCCPDGFWRQGNVEIVCQRYGVPFYRNYDTWLLKIKERLNLI